MAADLVGPGGGVRVLEVGHEAARARVERVDHELAVGRAGDLDAAVEVVARRRGDLPVALADLARLGEEVERRRRAPARPPARAAPRAARRGGAPKRACSSATKSSASLREDLLQPVLAGRGDVQFHGRVPLIEWSSRVIGWKIGSSRPSRCAAICSAQPGLPAATTSAPVATRLRRLARAELGGGLGLHEVVDAGRAAAQLPVGGLEQLELRDPAQQRARLRADALRVREVAGVVVGDAQRERMARRLRLVLGEQLGDVVDAGRERGGALGPLGVVGEQVRVVLHRPSRSRRR